MRRIGHFIDYIRYARGGAEINVEGLCRHIDQDFKLEIVTSKTPFVPGKFKDFPVPVTNVVGFHHIREASFLCRGALSDFFYRFPGIVLGQGVKKHLGNFDILHVHSLDVMRVLATVQSPPVVLTLYNPVPCRNMAFLNRADVVIVRSKNVLNGLMTKKSSFQARLEYVPPGCEFDNFISPIPDGRYSAFCPGQKIKLLAVARMRPFKNIPCLLEALALLRSHKAFAFELTLVGEGPEKRSLQKMVEQLDLWPQVKLHDSVPSSMMGPIYRDHDIVVVPSFYESFSQVALEALVSGVRLVASEGMSEFLSIFPQVPRFDPRSPQSLASVLIHAVDAAYAPLDKVILQRFNWRDIAVRHVEIYNEMLR